MILEHIEITGFRGINHLSLPLTQTTLLIGENAWGKSSLLDALSLLLAPQETPYQFTRHDFHFTPGNRETSMRRLQIVFHFRDDGDEQAAVFSPFWQRDAQGARWLYFSTRARLRETEVNASRRFLRADGEALPPAGCEEAISQLARLHPVLRLRDARFSHRARHDASDGQARSAEMNALAADIGSLTRQLASQPHQLSDETLRQGVATMQQLMEHYFLVLQPADDGARRSDPQTRDGAHGWRALDRLNQLIGETDSRSQQIVLLRMFVLLAQARGAAGIAPEARPLLLIENPETRLHPIMLSVTWNLLELIPLQKIATTNSGELLSLTPVENVCRLVREPTCVAAWRIGPQGLSAEESRRIGFHIRVNRPSALFARCWLLVEGETEVWIINELARQCGYHFAAEGVKVIEFAQAGLKPLLKFAARMGIAWHVLTDGDDAGNKYAATARSQLAPHDNSDHYLTQLPARDMEHYLFSAGFKAVYLQMAHLPLNAAMSPRRIITKALQHASKPELAIAVATVAAERGEQAMPPLMRQMFSRVMWLARGNAD